MHGDNAVESKNVFEGYLYVLKGIYIYIYICTFKVSNLFIYIYDTTATDHWFQVDEIPNANQTNW